MPRKPREKSESGIYHVIWRGVNRQEIFHEDEDRVRFLDTMVKVQPKTGIIFYGWCIMGNHVHLVVKEGREKISITMKRIGVSFALYYNRKYQTVGHLFEDRFKSEVVETNSYFLRLIRYIHQNPMKAGMVHKPDEWKWSSCLGYYGKESIYHNILTDREILRMFSTDLAESRTRFKAFNERSNHDQCLEDEDIKKKLSDDEARILIKRVLGATEIPQIKSLPREKRIPLLRKVKRIKGVSQRQAARILGISANLIFKA